MKRPEDSVLRPPSATAPAPAATLADIGFACLGEDCSPGQGAEADWLLGRREGLGAPGVADRDTRAPVEGRARAALARWLRDPPAADHALHALARHERLALAETMAIALARASELEPMAARALIWLQHPVGETRPTLGLLARLCDALGEPDALAALAGGAAQAHGLIQLAPEDRPLCERSVRLALPIVLALEGREGCFAGVDLRTDALPALAPSALEAARRHAAGLARDDDGARVLVIRAALEHEARAAATRVAEALGARPAFIAGDPPPGLAPWLWLRRRLPVLCIPTAPGDHHRLPEIIGHRGPLLVATGDDGGFEAGGAVTQWRLPVPALAERIQLWRHSLGDALAPAAIEALASAHRHGAGRIVELAQAARSAAARAGEAVEGRHVGAVARSGVGAELGALAELLDEDIADDALVLAPALREALDALLVRCRLRDTLADALGRAARTRYRPGVRALFVGPSGTGKTLAASWVATRLGLPLFRVDLAAVTSKYIGETEKNLSELFARAAHAEVVLLFDEADSLFGKRTDVKDANDRFANQQTNYLLQRIESHDGIVVLTSNSRARFDPAFTRRLDAILDFPAPGPDERRALWLAHLGDAHALDAAALNRIAAACDLAGGDIRNVVLAAAARTHGHDRRIGEAELLAALAAEYRKLGKPLPTGMSAHPSRTDDKETRP